METQAAQTTWSTGDVARMLKLSKSTLIRWIALGFLSEPEVIQVGRVRLRVWRKENVIKAWNHRKKYYWCTRSEIERGRHDGTQPGAERLSGDERVEGAGAPPSEAGRA
jgi:hypothetical protein